VQRQLLVAALAEPSVAAAAWRLARPGFDLDRLEPGSYHLLPMIYRNLVDANEDDELLPRLKGIYRKTWVTNNLLVARTGETHEALEREGIQSVFVEGIVAAQELYPDIGLRPSAVVVLVDRDDLATVTTVLRRVGWREPPGLLDGAAHVAHLFDEAGNMCAVRRRLSIDFVPRTDHTRTSTFWDALETRAIGGAVVRTLPRTESLLATIVLHARTGESRNIQWLLDATLMLERGIDWERLVAVAEEHQQTVRLRAALAYLAELPGPAPPAWVIERLKAPHVPVRERLGYLLSSGAIRGGGQMPFILAEHLATTADLGLLRVAATFPGELRRRWGLSRRRELPAALVRRAVSVLTMRRRRAA
jgi:hypothetical protein